MTLSVRLDAGANAVKLAGGIDEGMAALLAETLDVFGPSDAVVLDLSGVVYEDRSSLQQLLCSGVELPRSRVRRTAVVLPAPRVP